MVASQYHALQQTDFADFSFHIWRIFGGVKNLVSFKIYIKQNIFFYGEKQVSISSRKQINGILTYLLHC